MALRSCHDLELTCRSEGRGWAGWGRIGPTNFTLAGRGLTHSRAKSTQKMCMTKHLASAGVARFTPWAVLHTR